MRVANQWRFSEDTGRERTKMTDRSKSLSYENAGYISGKMVNDFSPKKTLIVLVIVVGCFAVLWPKVFYPMLVGSVNNKIKPSPIDRTQGCCEVISEKDLTTIKLMSEICNTIIQKDETNPLTNKELISKCQNAVLDTCGIDISAVLQEQVRLGHTTKQILQEIRSLNGSLCLKYNFGVATWKLGVPHRVTVKVSPSYSIRQERPLHLRSEMVHPAFRERGRAIPQSESFPPTKPSPPSRLVPKVIDGRPGPIPGMRPTIGGAGHVVPPSKHAGNSMGLIMPIYTIGIVVFFTYTVMKIVFKKQPEVLYPPVEPDPQFRREVFEADRGHLGSKVSKDGASSKIVVNAMSALLDEVDLELSSRRKPSEVDQQDVVANGGVLNQEDDQGSVQVLGMETTASYEGGQKWIRPDSPILPVSHTPEPPEPEVPPQEIFLEGSLPPQSHLLVTDSATEAQKTEHEEDPAVVLAGKMTLSVISLESTENGTDESSSSSKKHEERSSSNVSEDFEKIDVSQLEKQIDDILEQPAPLEQSVLTEIKQESINIEYPEPKEELYLEQDSLNTIAHELDNTYFTEPKETLFVKQSSTQEQEKPDDIKPDSSSTQYIDSKEKLYEVPPLQFQQEIVDLKQDSLNFELEDSEEELALVGQKSIDDLKQELLNLELNEPEEDLTIIQPLKQETINDDTQAILETEYMKPLEQSETFGQIKLDESLNEKLLSTESEVKNTHLEFVTDKVQEESTDKSSIIKKVKLDTVKQEIEFAESSPIKQELEEQSTSLKQVKLNEVEQESITPESPKVKNQEANLTHLEDNLPLKAMSKPDLSIETSEAKDDGDEIVPEQVEYISDADEDESDEEEEEEEEDDDEEVEEEEEDDSDENNEQITRMK